MVLQGQPVSRRRFLESAALTSAAVALGLPSLARASAPVAKPEVWVLHGTDAAALGRKAMAIIDANGGLGHAATTLTLKVNAGWARKPEQGANTHPELAEGFLKASRESGIRRILIPEHPCHRAEAAFSRSGLEEAAKAADAKMIDLKSKRRSFTDVSIPAGRSLTEARVAKEFLETDVLINMPVAKHHGGATLSMAMKNWMGAVEDRGYWHRNDLHQCIADFATFLQPRWTVIDATRIMLDRGPQGPGTLKHPNLVIVSRDQVAADGYTSSLFHERPDAVPYLRIAREMGLGVVDRDRMTVHDLEV
jgi:uncharacterized protein (DUF362 family)